jgi:hypothetical protein
MSLVVAHEGIKSRGLVLGLLQPSLLFLRRLAVILHVYFVRSTESTAKDVLFLMLYCPLNDTVNRRGFGTG